MQLDSLWHVKDDDDIDFFEERNSIFKCKQNFSLFLLVFLLLYRVVLCGASSFPRNSKAINIDDRWKIQDEEKKVEFFCYYYRQVFLSNSPQHRFRLF